MTNLDVPEGGGTAGAAFLRGVVMLSIVFGPWIVGIGVIVWVIRRVLRKRREAFERKLKEL